ncbi:MAG: hypothetical protein ACO3SP_06455 [Ilumatobacteraceae bacterium]
MTSTALITLLASPTITVRPWRDPVVECVGHDACGDYVELFWLGSLGPTATWLLRRLAVVVVTHPDGFTVQLTELARAVGLGHATDARSSLGKSLRRLDMFGLIHAEHQQLTVRAVVPPLPRKQVARLPDHLREAHHLWCDECPHPALVQAYACGQPT